MESRLLSQHCLMLQEEERRSLAYQLHDELGQCLNAIKLEAVVIRAAARGRQREIETSANAIVGISDDVYELVRAIVMWLRPVALDALGLHDALAHLVDQWQRGNADVACHFVSSGDLSALGEAVNITVYRFVQECLNNVAKHAQATQTTVMLERYGTGEVIVSVCDNGKGMDVGVNRIGLGLAGLRERVEALEGGFRIDGRSGKGLVVIASLPMSILS
jgi:signal transduction histidine kinase